MALTKISRGLLNTGVSDSSDATFLTVDSSENATLAGNLTVSGNLTVTGTSTTVDTVTMNAQNAVIFEGSTADNYETTLSIVDPTADHTQYLINQGGYVPVLAAATTTAITSTPAELNLIDGGTARGTDALASGDGILINDAGTMKMTNVDTVKTFMGTTTEEIQDIAGAMFTSNTETGITATYQDGDGTIDLVVGTLNQDTTGLAGTATALATARTIGGTSFDGTANIAVATATLATSITASANNSTDETVYPTFVDGATGTQGLETDTGLTYNPSTGMLTSTGVTSTFTGNITGNVTGNASGTALTVTQAAQTAITRVGSSLGIGITPTHNFNLSAAGAVEARFASTDNDCYLQISSDTDEGQDSILAFLSGTSGRGSITYDHHTTAATQKMIFKTGDNAVSAMTILGDGKVGIGTESPLDTLHVVGDIRIAGGNQMTNEIAWFTNTAQGGHYLAGIRQASNGSYNDSGGLQFLTSGTSNAAESVKMVINTQGNVGIGPTAPSADTGVARFLQIGSSADAHSGLVIEDNSGQWEIQNNGGMTWFYDGTSKMALTTGGDATHYGALNVNTTAGDGSESRFNVNPGGAGDNCTVSIKQDDASTVGVYLQGDGASWFTGGIVPGNSGTAAANNLDYYEEGTFTPTYTVSGGGSAGTVTSTNVGVYTKVGNLVHCAVRSFYVPTSGTVPTAYSMTLPFQAKNTGGTAGRGTGHENAQTGVSLFISVEGNGTTALIKATNSAAPPANSYFEFGFTYVSA